MHNTITVAVEKKVTKLLEKKLELKYSMTCMMLCVYFVTVLIRTTTIRLVKSNRSYQLAR